MPDEETGRVNERRASDPTRRATLQIREGGQAPCR